MKDLLHVVYWFWTLQSFVSALFRCDCYFALFESDFEESHSSLNQALMLSSNHYPSWSESETKEALTQTRRNLLAKSQLSMETFWSEKWGIILLQMARANTIRDQIMSLYVLDCTPRIPSASFQAGTAVVVNGSSIPPHGKGIKQCSIRLKTLIMRYGYLAQNQTWLQPITLRVFDTLWW